MHTHPYTPTHTHPPMHTQPCTPTHAHPPIHTHPCTPTRAHPPVHTHPCTHPHPTSPPPRWPTARWPVYVFLAGAMICLLTSTVCHTLGCCSEHVALWIWRIDYCGIAVLIVASFYPPLYYCFQCRVVLQWAYLSATTIMGACVGCLRVGDLRVGFLCVYSKHGVLCVCAHVHMCALSTYTLHVTTNMSTIHLHPPHIPPLPPKQIHRYCGNMCLTHARLSNHRIPPHTCRHVLRHGSMGRGAYDTRGHALLGPTRSATGPPMGCAHGCDLPGRGRGICAAGPGTMEARGV